MPWEIPQPPRRPHLDTTSAHTGAAQGRVPVQVLLLFGQDAVLGAMLQCLPPLLGGDEVHAARSLTEALAVLGRQHIDVVICDGGGEGFDGGASALDGLGREILVRYPWVVRLMLADQPSASALPGTTSWSERLLERPCPPARIVSELRAALLRRDLERHRRHGGTLEVLDPVALVVEDSRQELEVLRQALVHTGCTLECWSVPDGAQALEFLERRGRFANVPAPQVILLDLSSPTMNGYEFLSRYRSQDGAQVPVVVLSRSMKPQEATDALRHGAAAYVPTPTTWDRYLELALNLDRFARLTALAGPLAQRRLREHPGRSA